MYIIENLFSYFDPPQPTFTERVLFSNCIPCALLATGVALSLIGWFTSPPARPLQGRVSVPEENPPQDSTEFYLEIPFYYGGDVGVIQHAFEEGNFKNPEEAKKGIYHTLNILNLPKTIGEYQSGNIGDKYKNFLLAAIKMERARAYFTQNANTQACQAAKSALHLFSREKENFNFDQQCKEKIRLPLLYWIASTEKDRSNALLYANQALKIDNGGKFRDDLNSIVELKQ